MQQFRARKNSRKFRTDHANPKKSIVGKLDKNASAALLCRMGHSVTELYLGEKKSAANISISPFFKDH